jgi:hypothetical protein
MSRGGTGLVECFCAGDFCACSLQGEAPCEGCEECRSDWDDDGDEDDEFEEALGECGRGQGYDGCTLAGSEYCEFECPFRDDEEDE